MLQELKNHPQILAQQKFVSHTQYPSNVGQQEVPLILVTRRPRMTKASSWHNSTNLTESEVWLLTSLKADSPPSQSAGKSF